MTARNGPRITRRSAIQLLGVAGATSLIGCTVAPMGAVMPALQGYAWPSSVAPGASLQVFVSTTSPWFRIDIYRFGAPWQLVAPALGPFAGTSIAASDSVTAWGWDQYAIEIPPSWPSGVYFAVLQRSDASGAPIDPVPDLSSANGETKILFVVRAVSAPILYKLPLFTYHAYNETGGASLYGVWDHVAVTLRRPGGGTGHTATAPDRGAVFADGLDDPCGTTHDWQWNTFEKWDAKMLRWLGANGYAVDVCTDWDLHVDPHLLDPYRMVVSGGHDEYWSSAMRDHVEAFVAGGGNLAIFGGNTCFWCVDVDVDAATVACDKTNNSDGHWNEQSDARGKLRYENQLTGMCFHAGGYTSHPRASLGYDITSDDFWVFRDVEAQSFGGTDDPRVGYLVGYEVDGAPVDEALELTFEYDTPPNFHVLAAARLPQGNPSPDGWYTPGPPEPGFAMIGIYAGIGTVFNAGTTDWPRVLAGGEPAVVQITRNVIDRLRVRSVGRAVIPSMAAIASGAFADTDGQHALVLAPTGDVSDVAASTNVIGSVLGASHIAAYAGAQDLHAVVAGTDGIHDLVWRTGQLAIDRLLTGDHAVSISAFSSDDGLDHAVIATPKLFELTWSRGSEVTRRTLGEVPRLTAIAAYAGADESRYVIVGDGDGAVHALFWQGDEPIRRRVLVHLNRRVVALGAFRNGDQHHVIVAISDGNVYELTWHSADDRVDRDVLPYFGDTTSQSVNHPGVSTVRSVTAYGDVATGARHAVITVSDGRTYDVFSS